MSVSIYPVPLSGIQEGLIDAKGDLIVGNAADAPARLAVGTNNYVLTADSSATNGVKWAAVAAGGGGKVLQVVQATTATSVSIASTSYGDSGLSASITPTLSTSKILVLSTQHSGSFNSPDSGSFTIGYKLNRDINGGGYSTILDPGPNNNELEGIGSGGQFWRTLLNLTYLDSPATTSTVTYKTVGRTNQTANNQSINFQVSGATSIMILLEIGA